MAEDDRRRRILEEIPVALARAGHSGWVSDEAVRRLKDLPLLTEETITAVVRAVLDEQIDRLRARTAANDREVIYQQLLRHLTPDSPRH